MSETGVAGKLSPNKALIKRFSEQVVNRGNLDVLDDLVDEEVWFETTVAGLGTGRDAVRKLFKDLHRGFTQVACSIEALVEEDDLVAERFVFTAVHTGEFRGMRPSGASVRYRGMAFFRIADGKIVARWGVEDHLEMMRQIGVPVGPAGKK